MHEQRFCFASLLIFAVLVAVRLLSLLKPPILYCLLGYWHLIKNCADTSENKKHCKVFSASHGAIANNISAKRASPKRL